MTDYNGWKNYETWCIALWLGNEQGSESDMQSLTHDNLESAYDLGKAIKDYVEEYKPEVTGLYCDLLQSAIDAADFREIAEHYISDYEE